MAPPTNIPPVNPAPAKPAGGNGQVLQIVTLPEGLKENARAIRLEGEVVAQNKDGSTRIRTAEGDIDVVVRGKQLPVGTKVEVDVPVGHPPRNVTVRPAPAAQQPLSTIPTLPDAPAAQTPRPAPTPQTPPMSTTPDPSKPQPQPSTPTTQQPASTQATPRPAPVQTPPQLPPLAVGDVVEMIPLPQTPQAQTSLPNTPLPDAPLAPAPKPAQQQTTQPFNPAQQIEEAVIQKPQSGIVSGLLQSLKQSLPNILNAPLLNVQGQAKSPMPSVVTASTSLVPANTSQIPIDIPDLPQPVPIFAKIMAITSPTGQTMYAAPDASQSNAQAIQTTATVISQKTPMAAPPAQPITVTVSSVTPQGQPVVPLPINMNGAVQNFVIQMPPATLPVNSQVTLMPVMQPNIAATQTPAIPSVVPQAWRGFLPFMQASSTWPIMDELFQTFYHATPQAAQILGRVMPSPVNAQNLGPAIMLFAAAARAGELQNWVGDKKMDMIHKLGRADLVSRLSSETASLSNNNDLPSTEWKSLPVPMLWQNEISKVLFHVRREPDENGKPDKDGNTRFILDLSLPRMGEVQLDGIVNGKRLDLIVRTQMPVSYPMQEAMKVAYAGALEGSDVYGELMFQGDLKQWMQVIKSDESFAASV